MKTSRSTPDQSFMWLISNTTQPELDYKASGGLKVSVTRTIRGLWSWCGGVWWWDLRTYSQLRGGSWRRSTQTGRRSRSRTSKAFWGSSPPRLPSWTPPGWARTASPSPWRSCWRPTASRYKPVRVCQHPSTIVHFTDIQLKEAHLKRILSKSLLCYKALGWNNVIWMHEG